LYRVQEGLIEGQPFTLQYKPTKCVPPPLYSWSVADDLVGRSPTGIVTDKRVQIDENGEQSSHSFIHSFISLLQQMSNAFAVTYD